MSPSFQWDLPNIHLNLEGLWNQSNGPQWETEHVESLLSTHPKFQEKTQSGKFGFYDWPASFPKEILTTVSECADQIHNHCDGALLIGIGGSYLGPASIMMALRQPHVAPFPTHWLSNIDPHSIQWAKEFCRTGKIAPVIISKSGNTIEPLCGLATLSHFIDDKAIAVITDPESGELRRLAEENSWNCLEVPPNIGGRFSVLTSVGLLPTAIVGLSPEKLLSGALSMKESLESYPPEENPAFHLALSLWLWDQKYHCPQQYLMPYWTNLKRLADWYVQLWGESLGKVSENGTPVGPTPIAALGTSDQHSILQLMKQGPLNKVVGFVNVNEEINFPVGNSRFPLQSNSFVEQQNFETITRQAALATQTSLARSGVGTYCVDFLSLKEESLGAFFYFFEVACAFAAELYQVNAFDQPGVEEAKRLLKESLLSPS